MTSGQESYRRAARLKELFRSVLSGDRHVRNSGDAKLFLEAVRSHGSSPGACVETIVSSKSGVNAVRDAVRVDLSAAFALAHTFPFLNYLSNPDIKALLDGQLLERLLLAIAHPPTVWKMLFRLYRGREIPMDNLYPFAWLALELVSLSPEAEVDVLEDVHAVVEGGYLMDAQVHEVRELGYKIKQVLQLRGSSGQGSPQPGGPGGRHDNDHTDFREIEICPTSDEFQSKQPPFYQTAREVFGTDLSDRARVHIDNQFRLLREDMLAEMREDIQVATGLKKGKRQSLTLSRLVPCGIDVGDEANRRYKKCCLEVECHDGLQFLGTMDSHSRAQFVKNETSFLRHQSFGVLCRGNELFGFAYIDRDVDLLARSPPRVLLQFTDPRGLRNALFALQPGLKSSWGVQFILVDTPVFAYEPVLNGLKRLVSLPLQDVLLDPAAADFNFMPPPKLRQFTEKLQKEHQSDLDSSRSATRLPDTDIMLDEAQLASLIGALTSRVSLIQGPPGTGKSFIGAQIAKCIHQYSNSRILVISYTNHALDQFLEDLLKVGIPQSEMVRMGSKAKCTPATAPLVLSQQDPGPRFSRDAWSIIDAHKVEAQGLVTELQDAFTNYQQLTVSWLDISERLEFSAEDQHFYEALLVPIDRDGWSQAGRKGKTVGSDYLYQRWRRGWDAGIFKRMSAAHAAVWGMPRPVRESHVERWIKAMTEEHLEAIKDRVREFEHAQERISVCFAAKDVHILRQKRVIGCTTTAAAKYSKLIRAANPDMVLVEEAGEIMESHILTAMTPTVQQLVLIGDHKQLRPKINNYALSVERGDGFDLNRSLFERMIMQGARHTTLCKQHRMVPEISAFPRKLTYPELLDGPKTSGRSPILGLRDRVIFLNHGNPEDSDRGVSDRRDSGVKASKTNTFEAGIVLRILKYLGQQGYGPDRVVILTPYLGQLRVLVDLLRSNQHDPEISELDRFELLRAGLLSQAAAKLDKKPVRISTIDNYQGEESDIIIASLTRSNNSGDIGFMAAPERLNVLVTRARDCFVFIGNMETFMASKKGRSTWHPFFELLKENGHLYDGLPVKCERHPDRTALLKEPIDFDKSCPDGGCAELCNATLKCGIHKCTFRCHRVTDHTKAECRQSITKTCGRQHTIRVLCGKERDGCHKCISEDKEQERRIRRDLKLEEERLQRQAIYAKELQEIQDEMDLHRRRIEYQAEEEEQKTVLAQQRADLAALKETQARIQQQKKKTGETDAARKSEAADKPSADKQKNVGIDEPVQPGTAKADWERLKQLEGAKSAPLDKLMGMIGLEDVKREFLSIKLKVDTTLRQGVSLGSERFSCSLLGNPGTGKTTVARLYAQFLTDVGVIPGSTFKETSGSSLANLGVTGAKGLLDSILNNGGGVLFIDEAYQLTSGNSPGGRAVLDHLLAEVENLTGKVVFVLAGYSREMEGFFAHNPGLPSRFPVRMTFADYNDAELLRILALAINNRYGGSGGNMRCEDGAVGLYCRIVARRIGRGRGADGFGNARAVHNALSKICSRQANRLQHERLAGKKPDDFLFTKEDLIGPEPDEALGKCAAWRKLQELYGLTSVKVAVKSLVDSIQQNYQRELDEQPQIEFSLNKVFVGNPGTGKTTVAKLYGEILVALGLLSKAEVVVKNPSDFVGGALGQSEQQTKGILAASVGKVLVIDEAYGLYGGGTNQGSSSDPYKTAVIDTIVAEVQSVAGDDRCVLMLGYRDQMETMFQNVNPGLSRRFPMASAFVFEDFSDGDLAKILDLKLKQAGYRATDQAKGVAMDMLCRARNRPNFGNAGEIDNIMATAKSRQQTRVSREGRKKSDNLLQAQDFDEDFDRGERAHTNVRKLFEGTVGSEQTIALLEGYQDTVRTMKALSMDPKESIPFNFLFRGPPGTGKTTTAKKMGKVFYDMGFLATADVHECSATELVGQYVGQTGPKVQQLLDKALGRVLFVDEAYRLAEGAFAKEAMDELVDCATKDRYRKKLVIVLAGYEADINRLMSVNPGLTSRFPDVVDFRRLTADECAALLLQLLQRQKPALKSSRVQFDLSVLEKPRAEFTGAMRMLLSVLADQDSWANARDVGTLAQEIFRETIKARDEIARGRLTVQESVVLGKLRRMAGERALRAPRTMDPARAPRQMVLDQRQAAPQTEVERLTRQVQDMHTTVETTSQAKPVEQAEQQYDEDADYDLVDRPEELESPQDLAAGARRDAGVSDAVWEQLQHDRLAEQEREKEHRRLAVAAEKARGAARERIVKRLLEEEARRKREAELRKKLETSGVCPAGYSWVRQNGGFRCAGGSHYRSDGQLEGL